MRSVDDGARGLELPVAGAAVVNFPVVLAAARGKPTAASVPKATKVEGRAGATIIMVERAPTERVVMTGWQKTAGAGKARGKEAAKAKG